MPLVLAAVNAGFVHASLSLRYLAASLEAAGLPFAIEEGTRREGMEALALRISRHEPELVALSVSIWSHADTLALLPLLRAKLPRAKIALGGPEVTWLPEGHPLLEAADAYARGEADLGFPEMASALVAGSGRREWRFEPPDLERVALPYGFYGGPEIAAKFAYLESSRGCPFACDFCLSSIDPRVRRFDLGRLFPAWEGLIGRGARRFKFIDRTFNLELERSRAMLEFWRPRMVPGMSIQVEVVPDRLQEGLFPLIASFPAGSLRVEAGIQSYDPDALARISRSQDLVKSDEAIRHLGEAGAVVHADLIAGLPGEGLESFGRGLDRLRAAGPAEIQVGILKRLPGAPIARHDEAYSMRYSPDPPYEVISTGALPEADMARLKRFAKYWELVVGRGRYPEIVASLAEPRGPIFEAFLAFSDELWRRLGRTWGIAPEEVRGVWESWRCSYTRGT
jgi:radical SAM superfamily enzyme YgiQ (UPF0313 family)